MQLTKLLTLSLVAVLGIPAAALAAPFETEENFDDDALFPNGAKLPAGWSEKSAYHFHRASSLDTGQAANSGSYIFGVSNTYNNDVFYTALTECAAGKTFSMEFVAKTLGRQPAGQINPGLKIYAGPVQDISQMTLVATTEQATIKEWEKFRFDYTPAEDGEYCFAVQVYHPGGMDMLGPVWFDDFIFSGTTPDAGLPELEPNPDNLAACVEMPYLEHFDGENYDGTSYVPNGWLTVGDAIWRTANVASLPARSGDYYLIAPDNNAERNQRLYTPFFNLSAGVEYLMTFHTHFEGTYNQVDGQWLSTSMDVTAGTEQDADFHPLTLATIARNADAAGQWVEETVRFTPEADGAYCFSLKLSGPAYSGFVAMDDFSLTSPGEVPRPIPAFNVVANFNWVNNCLMTTDSTPIRLLNASQYADETAWGLEGLEYNPLPDGSADVFFPVSGNYSLELTATNAKGSRSTAKTYPVTVINEAYPSVPMLSYDPGAVTYYQRGEIPCYDTDENGLDYVSGFNHYYRCLAEKYILPADATFSVSKVSLMLTNLRYCPVQDVADQQQDEPFTISFYGADENGNPDATKLLGRHTTTMAEAFGTTGVGGMSDMRAIDFAEPIKVSGTVFVAFEFSDGMKVDVDDALVGRSFFSIGMLRHQHRQTTLYARPYALPAGSPLVADGSWYPVHGISEDARGFGLNIQLWADVAPTPTSIAIAHDGSPAFALAVSGDVLTVSGTAAGGYVAVYDMAGRQVALAKAVGGSTTIDCSGLPKGGYVVSTDAGAARFVR